MILATATAAYTDTDPNTDTDTPRATTMQFEWVAHGLLAESPRVARGFSVGHTQAIRGHTMRFYGLLIGCPWASHGHLIASNW